jgi:hypothetical protein
MYCLLSWNKFIPYLILHSDGIWWLWRGDTTFQLRHYQCIGSTSLQLLNVIHSQALGLPSRGFLITHIQTHSRTPLDEWSARRRDLYLHRTGQHNIEIQETNIHAPSGIRTRDPSNQAAADVRLRPRGHWDWQLLNVLSVIFIFAFRVPLAYSHLNSDSFGKYCSVK